MPSTAIAERLRKKTGLYVLRSEKSCFIRRNLSNVSVLNFRDDSGFNNLSFLLAKDLLDAIEDYQAAKENLR